MNFIIIPQSGFSTYKAQVMRRNLFTTGCFLIAFVFLFAACDYSKSESNEVKLKEEKFTYTIDSLTMDGYVVFDENKKGKRPAVLVVHEWWGLNDYPMMRARELAKMGYFAFAVDMYGNGKRADNPTDAQNFATPFYMNPGMAKYRLDAALAKLKDFEQADISKVAAIGYCFGGGVLLNSARLGENLLGVVSFHGSLVGTPADKDLLKAKILVCHGADDSFVSQEEVDQFRMQMDSIGADYTFISYPGATHAFTNPDATAMGMKFKMPIAYNAAADAASWKDMKDFFAKIFN
jgi:dienelactone hydrolase